MAITNEERIIKEIADYANELMAEWPSSRNRQRQFVLEYVKLNFGNATEAAKKAGYSTKTADRQASRMLNNVEFLYVQEVVDKLQEKYEERATELSIASATEIQQYLTSVIRGEQTDVRLVGLGDGAQVPEELRVDTKDRIRAAELLGKAKSMWTEKVDANVTSHVTIVDDIPDD
ncbi:terminase [Suicoccus acidiformans]|uniref:Terminase n=1 Tax=Suicoccus acidiformans TaxID=2036206 RepID=A0A347WIL1_9LACT|nr:terminase small subunit [Suicoccus acidiformans]AXY24918.1 terminase [Suicoccus acidiformans]